MHTAVIRLKAYISCLYVLLTRVFGNCSFGFGFAVNNSIRATLGFVSEIPKKPKNKLQIHVNRTRTPSPPRDRNLNSKLILIVYLFIFFHSFGILKDFSYDIFIFVSLDKSKP